MEIQLVFQWGRGKPLHLDLGILEVYPRLDKVISEHIAFAEEVMVFFQGFQGLIKGSRDLFYQGMLLGRQLVKVLIDRIRRLNVVEDAVKPCHQLC